MAKQKEHDNNIFATIDYSIDNKYYSLVDEINMYQAELKRTEKKSKKKAKKQFKEGKTLYPYEYEVITREHIVQEMEDCDFLTRAFHVIQELVPIAKIIARLVASLISAILSLPAVKKRIKKKTLKKMDKIYEFSMSV